MMKAPEMTTKNELIALYHLVLKAHIDYVEEHNLISLDVLTKNCDGSFEIHINSRRTKFGDSRLHDLKIYIGTETLSNLSVISYSFYRKPEIDFTKKFDPSAISYENGPEFEHDKLDLFFQQFPEILDRLYSGDGAGSNDE